MVVAIVVGVVACGRIFGGGSAHKACENIGKQCGGADFSSKDVDECAGDLPKMEHEVGKDTYDKFLTCAADADSCMEIVGCGGGLASRFVDKAQRDFDRGMSKMK